MVRGGKSGKLSYLSQVKLLGEDLVVYFPGNPLKEGGQVWVEAEGYVRFNTRR